MRTAYFVVRMTKHNAIRNTQYASAPSFRLRQHGPDYLLCRFSALREEKPHTINVESTALPKAEHANCVSPNGLAR
jgi:hypothetical protein